jgi:hypothetical protein
MGVLEKIRRRDDRRQARRHRDGRGPQAVPRGDGPDRPGKPARHHCRAPKLDNGKYDIRRVCKARHGRAREVGLPAIIRPAFTLGGTGGGVAYNRRGIRASAAPASMPPRSRRSSSTRACWAGRNSRWRSSATRRTTHHHLLHRKRRPDGRPYRRLDHRRARADADRQGIPDDARTPRSRCCARSGSRPAARTSSSP